jgi:hypothetical protein
VKLRPALALAFALACVAARASDGAGYVPAHRTKDGHYVPANVPPSSAATGTARRSGAGKRARTQAALLPPLLAEARPLRR